MPFMPVTSRMAKMRAERRKTLQGYEVKALGSRYESAQRAARAGFESEQRGLLSEYQSRVADYSAQLGQYEQNLRAYEQQVGQYQSKANAYNEAVNRYNTLTPLSGRFAPAPGKDTSPTTLGFLPSGKTRSQYLKDLEQNYGPGSSLGQAFAPYRDIVFNKDANVTLFDAARLPDTLVLKEVDQTKGGSPIFQLYQRSGSDPGQFSEAYPDASGLQAPTAPSPVDTSGLFEKYAASLKQEQDVYEREIGERKLSAQRARRRVSDRPLLSGERV